MLGEISSLKEQRSIRTGNVLVTISEGVQEVCRCGMRSIGCGGDGLVIGLDDL